MKITNKWKNLSRDAKIYYKKHGGFETDDYKKSLRIVKRKLKKHKRTLKLKKYKVEYEVSLEPVYSISAVEMLSKIVQEEINGL